MDISKAILAKSDQLNASDLTSGPRIVKITEVKEGSDDQPVNVYTDVFGRSRPFKPSKTVLRILGKAWGKDTTAWVGKSMEIFRDPTVRWAGEEIGGIRIKALSHIDKAMSEMLPTSKGKYAKNTVAVLTVPAAEPTPTLNPADIATWVELLTNAETTDELLAVWTSAGTAGVTRHPEIVAAKDARKGALS